MKRLRSKIVFMKRQITQLQAKNGNIENRIKEHENEIED